MSDSETYEYSDAELQNAMNKWLDDHEEEVEESNLDPLEIKSSTSEAYQEYHDRLKNGFILIFREFNLVK
ncbi:MAG: hypothetical protein ACI9S8_000506 [Chlamydiales bacterium]|jgi:hypothetical protein